MVGGSSSPARMPGSWGHWDDLPPDEVNTDARLPSDDESQSVGSQEQNPSVKPYEFGDSQPQDAPAENKPYDWSRSAPAKPVDSDWGHSILQPVYKKSVDLLDDDDLAPKKAACFFDDEDLAPKVNSSTPYAAAEPFGCSNDDTNATQGWDGQDSGFNAPSTGNQTGFFLPERVVKPSEQALCKMTEEERVVALQQYEDAKKKTKGQERSMKITETGERRKSRESIRKLMPPSSKPSQTGIPTLIFRSRHIDDKSGGQ
ncbi:hypothetical protein PG985_010417 [Apiospora marii]|uniref:Uncharacterized protein n=1 Tax=Apiospora marii TaxID=335849 RepID=A0ABR1S0T3_9PEZI